MWGRLVRQIYSNRAAPTPTNIPVSTPSANTARKVDVRGYLRRYGRQRELVAS